jgi:hypothetical protein
VEFTLSVVWDQLKQVIEKRSWCLPTNPSFLRSNQNKTLFGLPWSKIKTETLLEKTVITSFFLCALCAILFLYIRSYLCTIHTIAVNSRGVSVLEGLWQIIDCNTQLSIAISSSCSQEGIQISRCHPWQFFSKLGHRKSNVWVLSINLELLEQDGRTGIFSNISVSKEPCLWLLYTSLIETTLPTFNLVNKSLERKHGSISPCALLYNSKHGSVVSRYVGNFTGSILRNHNPYINIRYSSLFSEKRHELT